MKVAVLGPNWSPCAEPIDQTVVPATGLPSPSVQVKAAPPHSWTSIPRCRLYQACSAGASLALKKMPPMPVTRFIEPPRSVLVCLPSFRLHHVFSPCSVRQRPTLFQFNEYRSIQLPIAEPLPSFFPPDHDNRFDLVGVQFMSVIQD